MSNKYSIFLLSYNRIDTLPFIVNNIIGMIGTNRDMFQLFILNNNGEYSSLIKAYCDKAYEQGNIDGYLFSNDNISFSLFYHGIKLIASDSIAVGLFESDRVFLPMYFGKLIDTFKFMELHGNIFYCSLSVRGDCLARFIHHGRHGFDRRNYGMFIDDSPANGNIIVNKDLYLHFCEKYNVEMQDSVLHRIIASYGLKGVGFYCTADMSLISEVSDGHTWFSHSSLSIKNNIDIKHIKVRQ